MKIWAWLLTAFLGASQAPRADTLRVYVIDVEGGGATLVVAPSGQSMLIDSGSPGPAAERDSARIAEAMRVAGLTKINYLFTTHYDGDHVGGAPAANAVAHFDRFFDHGEMDPKWEQNRAGEDRYHAYLAIAAGKRTMVNAGDTIPFGDVHVDVVASHGAVLTKPINHGGAANCVLPRRGGETAEHDGELADDGRAHVVSRIHVSRCRRPDLGQGDGPGVPGEQAGAGIVDAGDASWLLQRPVRRTCTAVGHAAASGDRQQRSAQGTSGCGVRTDPEDAGPRRALAIAPRAGQRRGAQHERRA